MDSLAPLRRDWDLAVLANLAEGIERPRDLIASINAQAADGRRIGWKVLNDALRRLEKSGHVTRQEMPGVPRETRYRIRPAGHRLVRAVTLLGTRHDGRPPAGTGDGTHTGANGSAGDSVTPAGGSPGTLAPSRHRQGAFTRPARKTGQRTGPRPRASPGEGTDRGTAGRAGDDAPGANKS